VTSTTARSVHGPATGWRRLVRVVVLGGASYGLAVGAHLAGGGGWPGWPLTLMLAGLLGVTSVGLTGRRRGTRFLLLVLTGFQTVLHLLFARADGAAASCAAVAGGHHHVTAACAPGATSSAEALLSLPMATAHLVATVVTAWLLARGEAWLWRALDRLLRRPSRRLALEPGPVPVIRHEAPAPRVVRAAPGAPRGPPRTLVRPLAY
jgi:hypothetical protein